MKELFKQAHKLTKEILEGHPELTVSYHKQFGLCLSYLIKESNTKVTIKGEVTGEELEELDDVARAYAEYYGENEEVTFKIWRNYGYRRAYITCTGMSRYQSGTGHYYDFDTHKLVNSHVGSTLRKIRDAK